MAALSGGSSSWCRAAPVGAPAFYLSGSFVVITLPRGVCGPLTALNTENATWSPLQPAGAPGRAASSTGPLGHRPAQEEVGGGPPSEGRSPPGLGPPPASLPFSAKSERDLGFGTPVIPGGTFPQGHPGWPPQVSVLGVRSPQNTLLCQVSWLPGCQQLAVQLVAALPPPPASLGGHTGSLRKGTSPPSASLASEAQGRGPKRPSGGAATRRRIKQCEEWLVQLVKPACHPECGTHLCIGATCLQPAFDHLLQRKGGGERRAITDSKIICVDMLHGVGWGCTCPT